ncbi:O-antigen polymerase [Ornithinicoccus halotolerans]|uniref:O-antigen polymerase n=1 Tax=Ornithinicoccus halotolerans TaxID=1748220 RepID=UPI001295C213|nr:O-antigen polymerase [Ornithinicoccus halotolerans]
MSGGDIVVYLVYSVIAVFLIALTYQSCLRGFSVLPLVLFAGIEVAVVWPALVPSAYSLESMAGILAAAGLLAAALAYYPFAGGQAGMRKWRERASILQTDTSRDLQTGLWILTGILAAIGSWRLGNVVTVRSGVSWLLSPSQASSELASIRESRRLLTKGHLLLGEEYQGQGFFNALTDIGWQAVVAIAVLLLASKGWKQAWTCLFPIVLAFAFLVSSGVRTPVILASIVGATTMMLTRPPRARTFVSLSCLVAAIVLIIMPLSKGAERGGESLGERFMALVERVTDGNGRNNAAIVELVNSGDLPVGYGSLFLERLAVMVPGVNADAPFAFRLTQLAYGGGNNVTGYATPTQYGLLYADWGPVGVLFGYLFTGILLAVVWNLVLRVEHDAAPALAGVAVMHLAYMSITGVHGLLTTAALLAAVGGVVFAPGWLSRHWRAGRTSASEEDAGAKPHAAQRANMP